jgi:hypothetical protein
MKLKLYSKVKENEHHLADMIIHKGEIVQFQAPTGNIVMNESNLPMLPLKLSDTQIRFLHKYHNDANIFNTKIKFPDNSVFGFNLSAFERFKLKWIQEIFWIQKNDNLKWLIGLTIAGAIGGIWKLFIA